MPYKLNIYKDQTIFHAFAFAYFDRVVHLEFLSLIISFAAYLKTMTTQLADLMASVIAPKSLCMLVTWYECSLSTSTLRYSFDNIKIHVEFERELISPD